MCFLLFVCFDPSLLTVDPSHVFFHSNLNVECLLLTRTQIPPTILHGKIQDLRNFHMLIIIDYFVFTPSRSTSYKPNNNIQHFCLKFSISSMCKFIITLS